MEKIKNLEESSKYGTIVRLLSHFRDRDFLCLVFEPMHCNLRELIAKYGGGKGIALKVIIGNTLNPTN